MKALWMTNEFPPHIYGGAGVHVEYLSRELSSLVPLDVRCFGDQDRQDPDLTVRGFAVDTSGYRAPKPLHSVFAALQRGLDFNTFGIDASLVHAHTWYAHFGALAAKLNYGIPLVITVHSLEPLRPWKREQLGGGYDFSCWIERSALELADAIIAVSSETRGDILERFPVDPSRVHVIHNGIDPNEFVPVSNPDRLRAHGIDPDVPYVLFVGRITRQKGIIHLVRAIRQLDPGFQVVLCAGAPDTPEIAAEMQRAVAQAQQSRPGVIWIESMVDNPTKIALYAQAAVFCCPSIYEPFGIINLEAMACGTPVVASAVGGIKEVVVPGETGLLVPVDQTDTAPFEPRDPHAFSSHLAEAINQLMADPRGRQRMGLAGRERAATLFSWSAIAQRTHALYQSLLGA